MPRGALGASHAGQRMRRRCGADGPGLAPHDRRLRASARVCNEPTASSLPRLRRRPGNGDRRLIAQRDPHRAVPAGPVLRAAMRRGARSGSATMHYLSVGSPLIRIRERKGLGPWSRPGNSSSHHHHYRPHAHCFASRASRWSFRNSS
jgi:hypothetical protein